MPTIKVSQPFNLRSKGQRREFPAGDHQVSQEELSHWFVQACIQEGRAVVLAESAPAQSPEQAQEPSQAPATAYTEAQLAKLKRGALEEIADDLGLKHEGLPNKEAIVDLILEHQSGDAPDKDA